MAKYPTNPVILDDLMKISIKDLRRLNFLTSNYKNEIINVKNKFNHIIGSFNLSVSTQSGNCYAEFEYKIRCQDYAHKVPLLQFKSNLGKGFIWYFYCPISKKRCRVLYFYKNAFVHRSAIENSIYDNQTLSKKLRSIDNIGRKVKKTEELSKILQRPYSKTMYDQSFTKKMKQLISMNEELKIHLPLAT